MAKQEFGGEWTRRKLDRLGRYLRAYARIMATKTFRFGYIDAFAGTGYVSTGDDEVALFPELNEGEGAAYRAGSARIALEVSPAFTRYIFVEKSIDRCADLETLKAEFPEKADRIQIVHQDCNAYLMDLCGNYVWKRNRAVLFLDPFGMQVEWTTVKAIASTHAIDLWYLFPIGVGVNRLLRRDGGISEALSRRLDSVFGTHSWDSAFYRKHLEAGLFGSEESVHKDAAFDRIKEFLLDRMRRVFVRVAENPLVLRNSKNSPLFLLCFASGNERGATTAVKIAQDILKE